MSRLTSVTVAAATLALLLSGGANRGAAQQGSCTPSGTPLQVRSEGTVEALGPIQLTCAALLSAPTSLTITTTATLVPASATPDNIETFPLPAIASSTGFIVAPVVSVEDSAATFTFTPAAGAQVLTITGLLADIAASGLPVSGQILASITSADISLVHFPAQVGIVANGLGNGSGFPDNPLNIVACSPAVVAPEGEPATVAGNPDPSPSAANSLEVTLVEGFRSAFLTAANEGGTGGLQGTRFRIRLTGVPSGIIPYAPRAVRVTSAATTGAVSPSSSAAVIQRVDGAEEDGSGGAVLAEVADQFDKIETDGGPATIVYEVTTDSPATLETITLFIALTAAGRPATGDASVSLSLAPLGPPTEEPARPQFALSTAISLEPGTLTFPGFIGVDPPSQTLEVTNPGAGVLNWTAKVTSIEGGNWLTLSRTSGVGDDSITASADSSSLPIGTYKATVTFSSADAINSPRILPVTLYVSSSPVLAATPSIMHFASTLGGGTAEQQLTINSNCCAMSWEASVSTSSGGNWLSISPTSGLTATLASVQVNTAGLAAGTYQGTVSISGPQATNNPQTVSVSLAVGGLAVSGIVNGASLSGEAGVSPGLIAALIGSGLGETATAGAGSSLPTILGGTQVLVNGGPAPLFSVSPSQIYFQVPLGLSGTSAEITPVSNGGAGSSLSVPLAAETPGIFTAAGSGAGQGAVLNQDSMQNSAGNPAQAGSVVQIFATGLGSVSPQVPAGQAASASPLSRTDKTPSVFVGGVAAEVLFSGLTPGLVGVYQINARIPAEIQSNSSVPVQIQIGAATSNVVTIAVR